MPPKLLPPPFPPARGDQLRVLFASDTEIVVEIAPGSPGDLSRVFVMGLRYGYSADLTFQTPAQPTVVIFERQPPSENQRRGSSTGGT